MAYQDLRMVVVYVIINSVKDFSTTGEMMSSLPRISKEIGVTCVRLEVYRTWSKVAKTLTKKNKQGCVNS